MNNLKFRVFDNKMIYSDRGGVYGIDLAVFFSNYEVSLKLIMQSVGFKDKNGKEIYDKDICVFELLNSRCSGVGIVGWSDSGYWIGKTKLPFLLHKALSIEVIGNIYENPELCATIKN